ncbi:MAG: ATP-binding protein [Opitutaceae bacterium]|jgi:two-component system heavy metal sensor histidine kinase CusS
MTTFTTRITLQIAALVTGTTLVVLLAVGWMLERQMTQSIEFMQELEVHELSKILGGDPSISTAELAARIEQDVERDAELYYIQIHNEKCEVLFRSKNLGDAMLPDLTPAVSRDTQNKMLTIPGLGPLQLSEFYRGPWHIQIASPVKPVGRVLKNFASVSGLLMVAVIMLSLALGYGFSRVVLQPVRSIEQTARRIRGDNLGERITVPPGQDELSALSVLLNQMFDRIEASFNQVQRFTADASHELKTPLALIRLNAEKLRPRIANDAEASALLGDLLDGITRLNQIIESLLFIAKAESGVLDLAMKACDVSAFLAPFAEDARVLAEDRGVKFLRSEGGGGEARFEPNLMRQLLLNLLSNALNVSPPGGTITLESAQTAAGWRFVMMDEGRGVPAEQLERIFERFVRCNQSANAPRGHGLGLAICRTIVDLHGGAIRAENRSDRSGLRVVIDLPA